MINDSDKPTARWVTKSENKEYATPIFNILKRRACLPEEDLESDFYIIDAPAWVNVIAVTGEQQLILVEQFRHGIEEMTWEIPGGVTDPGEPPEATARRELREETGFVSERWTALGSLSSNPAILNNRTFLYLAEACVWEGDQQLDLNEHIRVKEYPVKDFFRMVREGKIHHSIVVAAAARWLLQRPELIRNIEN